jgi:RimJ/RimL family protein N-acetyltransferase
VTDRSGGPARLEGAGAGAAEIRTDRLLLRRLSMEEARAVVALDRAGRPWAHDYPTEGDLVVAGIACEADGHYDETGIFGVYQVLLASGTVVGGIGFIHPPENGAVEVGYGLAPSARGQGLATEALAAMVDLAAEHGADRVVAMTAVDNEASQRVLRRRGFVAMPDLVVDDEDGPMYRWELTLGDVPRTTRAE